jgi:hypothetical protein
MYIDRKLLYEQCATLRDTIKTVEQTRKLQYFLLRFIHKAQLEANIKALGVCLTYLM